MTLVDLLNPLMIVRLIAAVGGFVVGYMISGPLWRLVWRLAARKPVPGGLLPVLKTCTGLVVAALLYTLVGFGGGGGWGWGPGGGGGFGPGGTGAGDGKAGPSGPAGDGKGKGTGATVKTPGREIFEVEMLGGARYLGDGKFYLINRTSPPVALDEIETAFKARPDKLELHIHYVPDSVGQRTGPAERLRDLASKYQIPLVEVVNE